MQHSHTRGFTLVEMLLVVAIIGILLTVAIPKYQHSVRLAREAVLRENLHVMRKTIDQFTLDKKRAPTSLDELVADGYLRALPRDITDSTETWRSDYCDALLTPAQTTTGMCDVHSGSDALSTDRTPYSTW